MKKQSQYSITWETWQQKLDEVERLKKELEQAKKEAVELGLKLSELRNKETK